MQSVFSSGFVLIHCAHAQTAVGNHRFGAGRYLHDWTCNWGFAAAFGKDWRGEVRAIQHVDYCATGADVVGIGNGKVRDGESRDSRRSTAEHNSQASA